MLAILGKIIHCPQRQSQSHQKLHNNQSRFHKWKYVKYACIFKYFVYMHQCWLYAENKYAEIFKIRTKYAKYAKIWTDLHINVKFNKYVKYEQVAYRARDHTAEVWCCLKNAVLDIFHKYEKNIIISSTIHMQNLGPIQIQLSDLSPYICSQVHTFVYASVCLLAMVQQRGDQLWRRFLFCLQPEAWCGCKV